MFDEVDEEVYPTRVKEGMIRVKVHSVSAGRFLIFVDDERLSCTYYSRRLAEADANIIRGAMGKV